MATPQLLQLADTLARRHAAGGYTAEALLLHVEVLRRQGRPAEAADLVASAGEAAIPLSGDRRSLHASLLVSAAHSLLATPGISCLPVLDTCSLCNVA